MISDLQSQEKELSESMDNIFQGGVKNFSQVMRTNLAYPNKSKLKGIEGLAIIQVNVSSEGRLTANYMTRLDQEIEEQLTKLVSTMVPLWKPKQEDYTRYLAIAFINGKYDFDKFSEKIQELPHDMETPFLGIMQVRSLSNSLGKNTLKYYQKLRSKVKVHIEKEEFEKAYQKLNEMIRFNPFNLQDLLLRQDLEQGLGLATYRPYDLAWARALPKVITSMKRND